ncbi:hypothetical protein D0862_03058 [Hortaea werneckii]|uniref:Uncharacterized protein n=1 Tax=Hortaea werneckii TaxID=91943 RepID=A0A3M7HCE2_HORWE|nr:hypothetical protein D0862_03058 [Hortaea werneckii]
MSLGALATIENGSWRQCCTYPSRKAQRVPSLASTTSDPLDTQLVSPPQPPKPLFYSHIINQTPQCLIMGSKPWAIPVGIFAALIVLGFGFVWWFFPRFWMKGIRSDMKERDENNFAMDAPRGMMITDLETGERRKPTLEERVQAIHAARAQGQSVVVDRGDAVRS